MRYAVVGSVLPFLAQFVPWFVYGSDAYANLYAHCGYSHNFEDFRFYTLFLPIWILIIYNAFLYFRIRRAIFSIYKKVLGLSKEHDTRLLTNLGSTSTVKNNANIFAYDDQKAAFKLYSCFLTLSWYPIIQFIIWLPPTILRTYNFWVPANETSLAFKASCLIFVLLGPFLNGLVFLSYPSVRKLLVHTCCPTSKYAMRFSTIQKGWLDNAGDEADELQEINMDDDFDEYFGDSVTFESDQHKVRYSVQSKCNELRFSTQLRNSLL